MGRHVLDYFKSFSPGDSAGGFHDVIFLSDKKGMTWQEAKKKAPSLPKGWYELAHLRPEDRISMTRDYWVTKLPFCPHIEEKVDLLFEKLDDIVVLLTQKGYEDPFVPLIVYSIKRDGGFFRGEVPAGEDELISLQKAFQKNILPEDYMSFLTLHNGFAKAEDSGLLRIEEVSEKYSNFCTAFSDERMVTTPNGALVDPQTLIPFYESFGMPFYQCFWTEWYPESEMGNVYFSGATNTISIDLESPYGEEKMAFATFFDWLIFYLESVC